MLKGAPGATPQWTFTDAREPGTNDTAKIVIKNPGGSLVLSVPAQLLLRGNHQAHRQ